MTSWRTVRGHIQRLDRDIVTVDDINAFFAEERVLGRGAADESGDFTFEVAMAGRRRRVATLDDKGTVFRGRTVGELVEEMRSRLRKVEVELDGEVAHGPLDIGAVDVGDDLFSDDDALASVPVSISDEQPEESAEEEADQELFDRPGPMMMIADLPLSEVPALAKSDKAEVAVLKLGDALVLIAQSPLDAMRRVFPRPSFQIVIRPGCGDDVPLMSVRRDTLTRTWDWTGELPVFTWITPGTDAYEFVVDETGAGAMARAAVADVIGARFADVRAALLSSPRVALERFVQALGLPSEVALVLAGELPLTAIPSARLFAPETTGAAFNDRLAWELAGEGFVEPMVMGAYRKIYLERPWAVSLFSAAQSALGGALLTAGYQRAEAGKPWRLVTALGGATLFSGMIRILTTSYAAQVMNHRQQEIDMWKMTRNWGEYGE
ncbi:hypothetical protein [Trueperella sp. LYQ143]|uniref:hypothetical protein n=1 Tax=unclassified Trueperella TaxID=2630174 RepID=UPI003983BFDD